MNLTRISYTFLFCSLCIVSCNQQDDLYQENWESLAHHEATPEWFRDAKFGIYFHWGIYTVPEFGHEWYPARMYTPPTENDLEKMNRFLALGEEHDHYKKYERFTTYDFHRENFGDASDFGYKDFIPGFTCEKFDAEAWAELFAKSGAGFAGPVAEHHDGFALWDSEVTPFCAGKSGPERDLLGELEKAIKSQGMKFITTFHHSKNFRKHFPGKERFDELGMDYSKVDLSDPRYAKMYGTLPEEEFMLMWKDKLKEVIDKYQPDIIWFDSWLDNIPEEHRLEFAAYYLNNAKKRGKDVMICHKQQDLPMTVSTLDHERGAEKSITPYPWLSDDCVSPHTWSYVDGMKFYTPGRIIGDFVRTVSKNGQLLFNITPKSTGEIPEECVFILTEMGNWLDRNGDGIYATRPWIIDSEGNNICFTASKDGSELFLFIFQDPGENIQVESLGFAAETCNWKVNEIRQLSTGESISYRQSENMLEVQHRDIKWDPYVTGLKVTFEDFDEEGYQEIRQEKFKEYANLATYGERRKK